MPHQAAERVLAEVWGNRGFPVDPAWIATQFGVKVFEARFEQEVSGALVKKPGQDPIIMLAAGDSKPRKRFTCAHELGHYVKRQQDGDPAEAYDYVDLRDARSTTGTDPAEIFANQFAANLLMPSSEVKRLHKDGQPAYLMALHFGVSPESMAYRLNKLGCR
ncbi:ImmA/IrrE family metallo-endopeptidase [Silvimonas sp.]|uniref:ImmA/IrrE family metallo-endopeptidase n=1 Tax=Silvimonas sp. TaxID=2650811 RepID=UPI002847D186|nr:ImmA/IrrE family metallo-endopeptidase [Silvimonas sp.]MDR3429992.1 ImmA/IrrE family metallo-endopeptidase [Silvimonas sp.]